MIGYFYYGQAPSKADVFDYVVIFDNNLIVRKVKILAYREDVGGEIGSKRWLRQFNNLSHNDEIAYSKDIVGISGATISARSMTITVNNLLKSLSIIQNHNAL
jgi:Na+-translocating ferredoxin:NAD+ oxidoreductase RnfG subunit